MRPSNRLIFFGNERLSTGFAPDNAPTLKRLIKAGYKVVAIIANHHQAVSRKNRQLEVEAVAKTYDIPIFLPQKPSELHDTILDLKPEVGVLVAYGKIVPQSIIDLFPSGILNIHPSLLPLYRGSTPIEQAILDGAEQTGVSIMRLVKEMDAGPIFAQTTLTLNGNEPKHFITSTLLEKGGELLIEVLPKVLQKQLGPKPQQNDHATYCGQITKADGLINWQKTAERLEREIRAYANWPKSHTLLFGHEVIITKARLAKTKEDGALVHECNQSWLEIQELIAPSGKIITGEAFLRGYKK